MIGLTNYCIACDRQLVPPAGPVYARERGPVLHVPVLLGVAWGPALLAVLGGGGFVADWVWSL